MIQVSGELRTTENENSLEEYTEIKDIINFQISDVSDKLNSLFDFIDLNPNAEREELEEYDAEIRSIIDPIVIKHIELFKTQFKGTDFYHEYDVIRSYKVKEF